jgi:hypothetical protein
MITQAVKNANGRPSKQETVDNINGFKPDGTSREAALRSLLKNAPEIHDEVISGKLSIIVSLQFRFTVRAPFATSRA